MERQETTAQVAREADVDLASLILAERVNRLHVQVRSIGYALRGDEAETKIGSKNELSTLEAILGCMQETYDACISNYHNFRILGATDPTLKEPESPKPATDTILNVARLISGRLADTHHYLAGFAPESLPKPEQDGITDHILIEIAYSEMIVRRLQNALKEMI